MSLINAAAKISTLWAWLHAYSKSDRERSVEESGRARKRSYENIMAFKLKVVACTEGESSRGAARMFGVDEKRVREWRKLKAEIVERGQKKKRLQVGGKTVFTADKEKQLVSWIESIRSVYTEI